MKGGRGGSRDGNGQLVRGAAVEDRQICTPARVGGGWGGG